MEEGKFAQNLENLKPGVRARFYEHLSSLCYNKLRQNCLSVSHKFIFLFLLSLCAEITLYLNAPVMRSVRINFPQAIILNTTDYNPRPSSFTVNPAYQNKSQFLNISQFFFPVHAQLYNTNIQFLLQALTLSLFLPPTLQLIRDDRIIADAKIKLSPIKAQGPPLEIFSTTGALRIRTPYLCSSKIISTSQKLHCPNYYSNLTKFNYFFLPENKRIDYKNPYLCFSEGLLVSKTNQTGEIKYRRHLNLEGGVL